MSMQTIRTIDGKEYVLLPLNVYKSLKSQIKACLKHDEADYVPFKAEDYVDNPILLARIKANVTQQELANTLMVSQAYISKLEKQECISVKVMQKIRKAIHDIQKRRGP